MDLATYLAEENIKPAVFAASIDVPPSTITRILRGEREPRMATARKIFHGSGGKVTPSDLMGEQQPDLSSPEEAA